MTSDPGGAADAAGGAADAAGSDPVTPAPLSVPRAVVQGGAAVTATAGIAAVILLAGTIVVGILSDEVLSSEDRLGLLARGAIAGLPILVMVGIFGETLRSALESALLRRDVARLAAGLTPPCIERRLVHAGPHEALTVNGVAGIVIGALALGLGLLLAADEQQALLARVLVPSTGGLLLLGGIALTRWSRRGGRGRAAWERAWPQLAARWGRPVPPVPRARRRRRLAVLGWASGAAMSGAALFMLGVLMRQPGRNADPIEWAEPGERAIDGLVSTGAVVMGVALLALLAVHGGLLISAADRDRRTVGALERGTRVLADRVDAVLLDRSPLEHGATALGTAGWIVAAYGWAPGFMVAIESPAEAAGIQPIGALAVPGLLAVAAAWALCTIGAVRLRARRARIHAVLLRDPGRSTAARAPEGSRSAARTVAIGDASPGSQT